MYGSNVDRSVSDLHKKVGPIGSYETAGPKQHGKGSSVPLQVHLYSRLTSASRKSYSDSCKKPIFCRCTVMNRKAGGCRHLRSRLALLGQLRIIGIRSVAGLRAGLRCESARAPAVHSLIRRYSLYQGSLTAPEGYLQVSSLPATCGRRGEGTSQGAGNMPSPTVCPTATVYYVKFPGTPAEGRPGEVPPGLQLSSVAGAGR
jgi:hypothetical protein